MQGSTGCSPSRIGHSLEAWTSAFGSDELGSVLFSGGDDATLMAHDLRVMLSTSQDSEYETSTIWKARKIHDGGITSILPGGSMSTTRNPWTGIQAHHIWTGGYDDNLVCVDLRMLHGELSPYSMPKPVESMNLGGGVWRLIPGPKGTENKVVACCMYSGARVLQPNDLQLNEGLATSVKSIVEGHESMVYGADWSSDGKYISTCSFYDKAVQVWEV